MNRTNARISETDHGITGERNVKIYDRFQRNFRDKGILATDRIICSGIDRGSVLEIGPGPGYLGLEWLRKTNPSILTGAEISEDMIRIAKLNSKEYGLDERTQYVLCEGEQMPFDDENFDAVFTNGSLHKWSDPLKVFLEIKRLLVPGGKFFVGDLRRDVSFPGKLLMYAMSQPREIQPGFLNSVRAAYTRDEIHELLKEVGFTALITSQHPFGLQITGSK